MQSGVHYGDGRIAPLVAFSQFPTDWRTACIAVLSAEGDPSRIVEQSKQLGTPIVFVCYRDTLQWWRLGATKAEWLESVDQQHIPQFIRAHQDKFSPDAVYRAKTLGRFRSEYQLDFVDHGLMPLVEEEVGIKLGELIERNVSGLKKRIGWSEVSSKDGHWLIQTIFWLVSGKVLRDKGVPSFAGLDIKDVDDVFNRVALHYGSQPLKVGSKLKREALQESARTIEQFASLELTTTEALAHVYENTLISKATRSSLGTHSTPSYLVDYVVGNLAEWIEEIPENQRSVFEPACGHAAFLVSAMRLLSELLPTEKQIPSRRGPYLRSRLHGTDIDAFALELARLSLTLTDIPNPDGWDLRTADMFLGDELESQAKKNSIFFANPPFDNFTPEQQKTYRRRGAEVNYFNKAAEMLSRMLPQLTEGGVFGFVLPQTFLHSDNARDVRRFLMEQCELQEICLFPDKVFSFADAESAIILGRRRTGTKNISFTYRRVRERDTDAFRQHYHASSTRNVSLKEIRSDDSFSLRLPELQALWGTIKTYPVLSSVASLGQGLVYNSKDLPSGCTTFLKTKFPGAKRGFVTFDRDLLLHQSPTPYWMNMGKEAIRRPHHGTETGKPQILLNYAPASRGPWRLKALLDAEGHAVTSRFIPVRSTDDSYPLEILWALLNSPVANGYAFCHLGKRDNTVGDIRKIPMPPSTSFSGVQKAVTQYLEAAADQTKGSTLKSLLECVDCEVLKLYALPAPLERQLLDLFAGYERVGVPFTQDRYFPADFTHSVSLEDFLTFEKDWATTNQERGQLISTNVERTISPDEKIRLDALNAYADYYLDKTTPIPAGVIDEIERRAFGTAVQEGDSA